MLNCDRQLQLLLVVLFRLKPTILNLQTRFKTTTDRIRPIESTEEIVINIVIFVAVDFEADIKGEEDHMITLPLPNQEAK
jgi:hypothetical protein